MAAATLSAALCCLVALLVFHSVPTASGAWLWDLKVPKTNETTVVGPDKGTTISTSNFTKGPTKLTKVTPATTVAPSHPRLRSGKSNKAGSKIISKKQPHNTTTSQLSTTEPPTSTTQSPITSMPSAANEMEPKVFEMFQGEVPVSPQQNPSPIVIVEPDSFGSGGYTPASYSQPYGAMGLPPFFYAPPPPYQTLAQLSAFPLPPPPSSLPPYMSPYSPYPLGGFPGYQLPMEPDYHRTYRSTHFPYFPPVSGYPFGGYPGPYSPFSYPWWRPYQPEPISPELRDPLTSVNHAGCSSGTKRDREELEKNGKSPTEKSDEPSPTYVSLLPSVPAKAPERQVEPEKEPSAPVSLNQVADSEKVATVNNPYAPKNPLGPQNYNTDSPHATRDNVERGSNILRNNPFQQSVAWPGFYNQPQWPGSSPWQQWTPWTAPRQPQPQQYPYGVSSPPQQYPYGVSSPPQQYPYGVSTQPPQQYPYGVPPQHAAGRRLYRRQAKNPRSTGRQRA